MSKENKQPTNPGSVPDWDEGVDRLLTRAGDSAASRAGGADFLARFAERFGDEMAGSTPAPVVEVAPARRVAWTRWLAAAAAIILAVSTTALWTARRSSVGSLAYTRGDVSTPGRNGLRKGDLLTTAAGGNAMVALDNQRVNLLLAEDSAVQLAANDVVKLRRGEIWTTVRENSGFFQVQTQFGDVTVHGTTFGVTTTDSGMEVRLARGSVQVRTPTSTAMLAPGDAVTVSVDGTIQRISLKGELTPDWARELFNEAQELFARQYFPSVSPPARP